MKINDFDRSYLSGNFAQYAEIENYLNKTYNNTPINPIATVLLNATLRDSVFQEAVKQHPGLGPQVFIQYFQSVELIAKSSRLLSKDSPAIIVCLQSELAWLHKFAMNEKSKIIAYSSYELINTTQALLTYVEFHYDLYKTRLRTPTASEPLGTNRTGVSGSSGGFRDGLRKKKKRILNFYYNRDNQEFYHYIKSKANMSFLYDRIKPHLYDSVEHLVTLFQGSKPTDTRIIIAPSRLEKDIKNRIPENSTKPYKLLVYNNNNSFSVKQDPRMLSTDPYERLISSKVINFWFSSSLQDQVAVALYALAADALSHPNNKLVIEQFGPVFGPQNQQSLQYLMQGLTEAEYAIVIAEHFQVQQITQAAVQHECTNMGIIEHYLENLRNPKATLEDNPYVLDGYSSMTELISYLNKLKQDIQISSDPIFGLQVRQLNVHIHQQGPRQELYYQLLQKCEVNALMSINLHKYKDSSYFRDANLAAEGEANLIVTSQSELLSLYKLRILSSQSQKCKVIIYPTDKALEEFRSSTVVLAAKHSEEIISFIKGFDQKNQFEPQHSYQKSVINPNRKFTMKAVKRIYENPDDKALIEQDIVLPQEGRPKIYVHLSSGLRHSEIRIFKNRLHRLFKNDLVCQEYSSVQQLLDINMAEQPLCFMLIDHHKDYAWALDFAKTYSNQVSLRMVLIAADTFSMKIEAVKTPGIRLVTSRLQEAESYIVSQVKIYEKKHLTLLNKIYKQFLEGANKSQPIKIFYTQDKPLVFPLKGNKTCTLISIRDNQALKSAVEPQTDKFFIIADQQQLSFITNEILAKKPKAYLLVAGDKSLTAKKIIQNARIVHQSRGYKQLQQFIHRVILREEQADVNHEYNGLYEKWAFMKKKMLVYSSATLTECSRLTQLSELEQFEFRQFSKLQTITPQFIQLFQLCFVVTKDSEASQVQKKLDSDVFGKVGQARVHLVIQNATNIPKNSKGPQSSSVFAFISIDQLRAYLCSFTSHKKQEFCTRLFCVYNLPILLHPPTLSFKGLPSHFISRTYANIDQLRSIINEIKRNPFVTSNIILCVENSNYAIVRAITSNLRRLFFVIYGATDYSQITQEQLDSENLLTLSGQKDVSEFVDSHLGSISLPAPNLHLLVESNQIFNKLEERLQKRTLKLNTKITLATYTGQIPSNLYSTLILVVILHSYQRIKASLQRHPLRDHIYVIIDGNGVITDPNILFGSGNTDELLSFLSNLQRSEPTPFLQIEPPLTIYCPKTSFTTFQKALRGATVQGYPDKIQLDALLASKQVSTPIVVLPDQLDKLLIQSPINIYRIVVADPKAPRPLFQSRETIFVGASIDKLVEYSLKLVGQEKQLLYPQVLLGLYNKHYPRLHRYRNQVYANQKNLISILCSKIRPIRYNIIASAATQIANIQRILSADVPRLVAQGATITVFVALDKECRKAGNVTYTTYAKFEQEYLSEQPLELELHTQYGAPSQGDDYRLSRQTEQQVLQPKRVVVGSIKQPEQTTISSAPKLPPKRESEELQSLSIKKTASFGQRLSSQKLISHQHVSKNIQRSPIPDIFPLESSYRSSPQHQLSNSLQISKSSDRKGRINNSDAAYNRLAVRDSQKKLASPDPFGRILPTNDNELVQVYAFSPFSQRAQSPQTPQPRISSSRHASNQQLKGVPLVFDISNTNRQARATLLNYQSNYPASKIYKVRTENESIGAIRGIGKDQPVTVVLDSENEEWLDSIQFNMRSLFATYVIVGRKVSRNGNKIYLRTYPDATEQLRNINIEKNRKLIKSSQAIIPPAQARKLQEPLKKQKLMVIKKVKETTGPSLQKVSSAKALTSDYNNYFETPTRKEETYIMNQLNRQFNQKIITSEKRIVHNYK